MKRLILLIITCYGLLLGYANTDTASDSLLQMLQTLPHDTTRLSTECNHKNRAKQLQMYPIFGHVDARGIKTKE